MRNGRADRVLGRVRRSVRRMLQNAPSEDGPLLVAVSGGQDSVCLLDALASIRLSRASPLHVVHVNHQLRGRESDEDARFVGELAARYDLSCSLETVDVASYRARHRLSTQVAARYARYQTIARVARGLGTRRVAVAHTRDDLVETLLLNLMRGAGSAGLASMRPVQTLPLPSLGPALDADSPPDSPLCLEVIRPLLDIDRADTLAYCRARGLAFREDRSNTQQTYARNRVRSQLLPLLERFNPAIRAALARTARAAADDAEIVSQVLNQIWPRVGRAEDDRVVFRRKPFADQPVAVRRRLIRLAVERLRGTTEGLTWASVERAARLVAAGSPAGELILPGGIWLRGGYDEAILSREREQAGLPSLPPEHLPLQLPGRLELEGIGTLHADLQDADQAGEWRDAPHSPWLAWADLDSLDDPLAVRRRRPGDRMYPLGLGHSRKLQDVLVDARVPRAMRDSLPVLACGDRIVWIPGLRPDERFAPHGATRRLVRFRFEPGPQLAAALGWQTPESEAPDAAP